MPGNKQRTVRRRKRELPRRLTGNRSTHSPLPVTVTDVTETIPGSPSASPAPTVSDRKLSRSPYLSLGTVQETGELDLSDFEGDFECLSGTGARVLELEGLQGSLKGSLKEICACKVLVSRCRPLPERERVWRHQYSKPVPAHL